MKDSNNHDFFKTLLERTRDKKLDIQYKVNYIKQNTHQSELLSVIKLLINQDKK